MIGLLIYPLLTAALFYLGSRAVITQFIWSRYPTKLAKYFDCAACSGTMYGFVAANVLRLPFVELHLPFVDLAKGSFSEAIAVSIVVALCSMVWTPIIAEKMETALSQLGSAVGDDEDGNHAASGSENEHAA